MTKIYVPHTDRKLSNILFKNDLIPARELFYALVEAGKVKVDGEVISDTTIRIHKNTTVEIGGVKHEIEINPDKV